MDATRYFHDRVHTELEDLHSTGDTSSTVQQVQEHVARRTGYSSWRRMQAAEVSELELAAAMDQEPWLTTHGLGPQRHEAGENKPEFTQDRADLRGRHETVELIHHWLLLHLDHRHRTIDTATDSYTLKNLAEQALETQFTHGEVIAAAIIAGHPYRRSDQHSLHAVFDMGRSSIAALPPQPGQ